MTCIMVDPTICFSLQLRSRLRFALPEPSASATPRPSSASSRTVAPGQSILLGEIFFRPSGSRENKQKLKDPRFAPGLGKFFFTAA